MVTKFLAFSFCVAALLLSGCSPIQALIQPPKVELKNVNIANVGLKGIDLDVNLEILNPNSTPLTIDSFKYNMAIGNSTLFDGLFNTPVELKAGQKSLVSIPVKLTYENSKTAVQNYLFKSERNYKLTGMITSGVISVPIKEEGKIEIKR